MGIEVLEEMETGTNPIQILIMAHLLKEGTLVKIIRTKLVEKYNDLAREALSNGDKILSENYLQHSEHFSRILISQEKLKNHSENTADNSASEKIKIENENIEVEELNSK